MGKVWMIASGKGGTGKSSIAAGLAVTMAKQTMRVLLIDADIGLRCLDLLMGLQDKVLFELSDCLDKRCALMDAVVQHPNFPSLYMLAGGQNARPGEFNQKDMSKIFKTLKKYYDIVLVDCPAGLGRGFRNIMQVADEALLVATPDEICLRDAEKTAATLFERSGLRADLVLNRYDCNLMKKGLIRTPQDIGMSLDMRVLGAIPNEGAVYRAMLSGKTMAECGATKVEQNLYNLSLRMQGRDVPVEADTASTLQRLIGKFGGGTAH